MAVNQTKLSHLQWSIDNRHVNQRSALKLLELFQRHEKYWTSKQYSIAAQDLLSISFSLWRAVFLAEKSGKRLAVFQHGVAFLERVIEDNSISYPNDKISREWTFNFYTKAARRALESLNRNWDQIVTPYVRGQRTPTKRWEYCQELLDAAIENFDAHFLVKAASEAATKKAAAARLKRKATQKQQRKISRQISITDR